MSNIFSGNTAANQEAGNIAIDLQPSVAASAFEQYLPTVCAQAYVQHSVQRFIDALAHVMAGWAVDQPAAGLDRLHFQAPVAISNNPFHPVILERKMLGAGAGIGGEALQDTILPQPDDEAAEGVPEPGNHSD